MSLLHTVRTWNSIMTQHAISFRYKKLQTIFLIYNIYIIIVFGIRNTVGAVVNFFTIIYCIK